MTLYFVLNARIPSKKAYGIHVAKMCEAFTHAGLRVVLVVPGTRAARASLQEFHGLTVSVPMVRIPVPDWYGANRTGFLLSSLAFMLGSFVYLCTRARNGSIVYTADMDTFSFALLPYAGLPVFAEMHDWRGASFLTRAFFKRARAIITTNTETAARLTQAFRIPEERLLVEANGVDASWFDGLQTKAEARTVLGMPEAGKIALYAGRAYDWKGLDILADSAQHASDIEWYLVGATAEEFKQATGVSVIPTNLHLLGEVQFSAVPQYLSTADVLLVIGTKRNSQSWQHTSPMKVYEYMARERPIVASKTPALTSIMNDAQAIFVAPDDAAALIGGVRTALSESAHIAEMVTQDVRLAREHTWDARAARIKAFMASSLG